jgi:hypothetical protein
VFIDGSCEALDSALVSADALQVPTEIVVEPHRESLSRN